MKRYLDALILNDLSKKAVILTGPRQVGKTTLSRQLMAKFAHAQYLNWDVPADREILQRQTWNPKAGLLVVDEIHKMRNWKSWLKGVIDARPKDQAHSRRNGQRRQQYLQEFASRILADSIGD